MKIDKQVSESSIALQIIIGLVIVILIYKFIDTKKILTRMIDNNITDVYYSDDTHWSWKASQEIFKKDMYDF